MSFEIVREKPYFVNVDGKKYTHLDTAMLLSFIGTFIDEDGKETTYRFGYDFNKNEYVGIEVVSKEEIEGFDQLHLVYFPNPNPNLFSIENLERGIARTCFSDMGRFIIKKFSDDYDCFFS